MEVAQIMNLISDEKLIELGKKHNVDKINHKITGAFILKSFVHSSLLARPISLRTLEIATPLDSTLNSLLKSKKGKKKVDHSSIGKRLETIKVEYFQEIYQDLVVTYNNKFNEKTDGALSRFDSTIINLSGRMIKDGLKIGGKASDSQIKISVELKNQIPASVRFCKEQSESSEDIALVKAINEAKIDKGEILLFDRGISKANTYTEFTKQEMKFVTRVRVGRKYEMVKKLDIMPQKEGESLRIQSDEIVNLYDKKKVTKCNLRLIKAVNLAGEELWFLTNLEDSAAIEIANMYKRRWDIEVFFKFLKQNLQFKNFISYSQNGMSVYLYSILIAAILFTIFKTTNKLPGFKLGLLKFCMLLEKEIMRDIVILSGGNINLVKDIL